MKRFFFSSTSRYVRTKLLADSSVLLNLRFLGTPACVNHEGFWLVSQAGAGLGVKLGHDLVLDGDELPVAALNLAVLPMGQNDHDQGGVIVHVGQIPSHFLQ